MASAANPPSSPIPTPQLLVPPTASDQYPIANEEAVVSDSSLSQTNSHSISSTPASSFSFQRPSPNPEGQTSSLQPVPEIELSTIRSHGDPSQSNESSARQRDRDEANQQSSSSTTLTGEHVGSWNTLQSLNRQWSYAASVQGSLRTFYEHLPNYEVTSNLIGLFALALTAFFGYETYQLTKESNRYQRLEFCNDEKMMEKWRDPCQTILNQTLPRGASITKRVGKFLSLYEDAMSALIFRAPRAHNLHRNFTFLGLMISISLLIDLYTGHRLRDGLIRSARRLRRNFGHHPNAFDPVHVRLTHPQDRTGSGGVGTGTRAGQLGGRRRIIPGIYEQTYDDYDRGRKRSFQPHFETLLSVPFWKRRSLGSLPTNPQIPAPIRRASTEITASIGDALKGSAPDDLVLSPGTSTHILHRVLSKVPFLHYGDSDDDSDDDIEPPLTALLADWKPDQGIERKVAITSGVVALGLAQAGSALASSVGGCVGPDILVRSESIDKMMNLTLLPTSQDTVATGVER